jgi:hypothetical protein
VIEGPVATSGSGGRDLELGRDLLPGAVLGPGVGHHLGQEGSALAEEAHRGVQVGQSVPQAELGAADDGELGHGPGHNPG